MSIMPIKTTDSPCDQKSLSGTKSSVTVRRYFNYYCCFAHAYLSGHPRTAHYFKEFYEWLIKIALKPQFFRVSYLHHDEDEIISEASLAIYDQVVVRIGLIAYLRTTIEKELSQRIHSDTLVNWLQQSQYLVMQTLPGFFTEHINCKAYCSCYEAACELNEHIILPLVKQGEELANHIKLSSSIFAGKNSFPIPKVDSQALPKALSKTRVIHLNYLKQAIESRLKDQSKKRKNEPVIESLDSYIFFHSYSIDEEVNERVENSFDVFEFPLSIETNDEYYIDQIDNNNVEGCFIQEHLFDQQQDIVEFALSFLSQSSNGLRQYTNKKNHELNAQIIALRLQGRTRKEIVKLLQRNDGEIKERIDEIQKGLRLAFFDLDVRIILDLIRINPLFLLKFIEDKPSRQKLPILIDLLMREPVSFYAVWQRLTEKQRAELLCYLSEAQIDRLKSSLAKWRTLWLAYYAKNIVYDPKQWEEYLMAGGKAEELMDYVLSESPSFSSFAVIAVCKLTTPKLFEKFSITTQNACDAHMRDAVAIWIATLSHQSESINAWFRSEIIQHALLTLLFEHSQWIPAVWSALTKHETLKRDVLSQLDEKQSRNWWLVLGKTEIPHEYRTLIRTEPLKPTIINTVTQMARGTNIGDLMLDVLAQAAAELAWIMAWNDPHAIEITEHITRPDCPEEDLKYWSRIDCVQQADGRFVYRLQRLKRLPFFMTPEAWSGVKPTTNLRE